MATNGDDDNAGGDDYGVSLKQSLLDTNEDGSSSNSGGGDGGSGAVPAKDSFRLSKGVIAALVLPNVPFTGAGYMVSTSVLGMYTRLGVGATTIAVIQFLGGMVATYLQLVLGYMGDGTRSKYGRRRPYIALGLVPTCIAIAGLFLPTGNYAVWYAIFSCGYVISRELVTVPMGALSTEMTTQENDRRLVFSLIGIASIAGVLLWVVLQAGLSAALQQTGSFLAALLAAVGCLVSFTWLIFKVKENPQFTRTSMPLIPGVRTCLGNQPWVILTASNTMMSLMNEITGLFQLLIQYEFLADPNKYMPLLVLPYILSQVVCTPIVYWCIKKWGKLIMFKIGVVFILVYAVLGFFLSSRESGMFAFCIPVLFFGAGLTATNIVGNILSSDVIDYDELHTGRRREGTYQSIGNVPAIFFSTAGRAVPVMVLAVAGFNSGLPGQTNSVRLALRAMLTLFPGAVALISVCIFFFFKMDENKHREIMYSITQMKRGEPVNDPMTGYPVIREHVVARQSEEEFGRAMSAEDKRVAEEFLLYFSHRELIGLASNWRRRIFVKFGAAIVLWILDMILCIVAALRLLSHGNDTTSFLCLALAAMFSIAAFYEIARLKGMRWLLSKSKDEMQTMVLAFLKARKQALQQVDPNVASDEATEDEVEFQTPRYFMGRVLVRFAMFHGAALGASILAIAASA